jgi:hypothetical protein
MDYIRIAILAKYPTAGLVGALKVQEAVVVGK